MKCTKCNREFEEEYLHRVASHMQLGALKKNIPYGNYCTSCFIDHCIEDSKKESYMQQYDRNVFDVVYRGTALKIYTNDWGSDVFNGILETAKLLNDKIGLATNTLLDSFVNLGFVHGNGYCISAVDETTKVEDSTLEDKTDKLWGELAKLNKEDLCIITYPNGNKFIAIRSDLEGFVTLKGETMMDENLIEDSATVEKQPKEKLDLIKQMAYGLVGLPVFDGDYWK